MQINKHSHTHACSYTLTHTHRYVCNYVVSGSILLCTMLGKCLLLQCLSLHTPTLANTLWMNLTDGNCGKPVICVCVCLQVCMNLYVYIGQIGVFALFLVTTFQLMYSPPSSWVEFLTQPFIWLSGYFVLISKVFFADIVNIIYSSY